MSTKNGNGNGNGRKERYDSEQDVEGLFSWRRKVHDIIFGVDTFSGKAFDIALLIAIVLSVLAVMLESVQEIGERYGTLLHIVEWVFTILFTIEYVARLLTVGHPWRYAFSFMGLVDLLSILPSFLSLVVPGGQSLMIIRSIRLLRIFRILKLYRYMVGARRLIDGLYSSRYKITVFLGAMLMMTILLGTVMFLVEGKESGFTSIPRSVYWAIVTITTVGYGDIAPVTVLGQLISSLIMLMGYAIIAVPTGIISAEMINRKAAPIDSDTQPKDKSCPRCHSSRLAHDAHFCRHCGYRIDD